MIRLLLDQGLPRSAVELLRADGWDAVHVLECGLGAARDEQKLEYARTSGYVVCTLERGPELALLLKRVWNEGEPIKNGAAVRVTDPSVRVRRLPILGDRAGSNP